MKYPNSGLGTFLDKSGVKGKKRFVFKIIKYVKHNRVTLSSLIDASSSLKFLQVLSVKSAIGH